MKIPAPPAGKLFTRNFLLVWAAAFFAFNSFHMLLPVLPLYVIKIGGTESQIGLLMGVLTVTSVTVRPWIGRESDRRGKQLILVWGTLALVVSAFSYAMAVTVVFLMLLRLFHGAAWAAVTTPSSALVADLAPPERRAEAMGWFGTGSSLAMAVAPLLAVFLSQTYGFSPTFLVGAGLAAVSLAAAALVREPDRRAPAGPPSLPASPSASLWQAMIYRPALGPAIAAFVINLTYGSIVSFLPLLAYKNDINPGVFFSVYAVFLVVSRPIGGKLSDVAGRNAAIFPGTLAIAASLALLAFAGDWPHFLVSAALYGIGFSFVNPSLMAITADRAAPEARGAAMGTFSAAFDLGIGVGAIMFGLILEKTSFQVLYLTSAGIAVASLITYVIEGRRR